MDLSSVRRHASTVARRLNVAQGPMAMGEQVAADRVTRSARPGTLEPQDPYRFNLYASSKRLHVPVGDSPSPHHVAVGVRSASASGMVYGCC